MLRYMRHDRYTSCENQKVIIPLELSQQLPFAKRFRGHQGAITLFGRAGISKYYL